MKAAFAAALITATLASTANAEPRPAPASMTTPAIAPSFAKSVERALLSSGISAIVYQDEKAKLTVFAYLNQSLVYQLAVDAKLLEGAHRSGLRAVDFFDKGGAGHWIFDLSGGVPRCDIRKRLCL